MTMNRLTVHALLSIAVWCAAAAISIADEGRIPIFRASTIDQPGHYVVTRDIAVTGGVILDIQADGVTVDLNGHTLSSSGLTEDLIQISGCGARGVSIGEGRLMSGLRAIHALPPGPCKLSVHDLAIGDPNQHAILVEEAGEAEIRGIIIEGGTPAAGPAIELRSPMVGTRGLADLAGISIKKGGGILMSHMTGNLANIYMADQTDERPVELNDCDGSVLVGIIIIGGSQAIGDPNVKLIGSSGVVIEQSALHGTGGGAGQDGIFLDAQSGDCTLRQNSISGFGHDGFHLLSQGNLVTGNLVNGNASAGIFVAGANNLLEANKVGGNGLYGLWFDTFDPRDPAHVYRNNVLRGNPAAIAGPGATQATDAGGNVQ